MSLELEETAPAPVSDQTVTAAGAAVPASGLLTGKQLGHFRIDRRLGAGGMGEVYLATDLALDRPVAVKVLPEAVAREPKRRDRLIREARAQARVAHPNVGHMYFVGEEEHRLFFAMEYVAGETLAERIARGPMPVDEALDVIRAVALGLREAGKAGITHRDIKPSNLMIDAHGVVKVLDFGLAAGDLETITQGPVAQTSLAGTPLYMAPEQARGDAVDFRTDIYALGATLFHLVSGKPPFEADSVEGLVSLHATAARPALPRRGQRRVQITAIDALCHRMMAAKPEDRFASYDDLVRALELASDEHTKPGGFWARNLATVLDFAMIGIVVAIANIAVRLAGNDGGIPFPLTLPLMIVVHTLTLARYGRTPGKAVMELEVVAVATLDRPTRGQAFRRSLVLFLIPLLIGIVGMIVETPIKERLPPPVAQGQGDGVTVDGGSIAGVLIALYMVIGQCLLTYAALRVTGKRTLWDRLSGTLVRYRTTRRTTGRS